MLQLKLTCWFPAVAVNPDGVAGGFPPPPPPPPGEPDPPHEGNTTVKTLAKKKTQKEEAGTERSRGITIMLPKRAHLSENVFAGILPNVLALLVRTDAVLCEFASQRTVGELATEQQRTA